MSETNITNVEYRMVEGFPGYRVGDDGSVWGCRVRCSGRIGSRWHRLKPRPVNGYQKLSLMRDRRKFDRYVQVLVLTAFRGPAPDGMQACHDDNDRANNQLSNLRWDTQSENEKDKKRHGTAAIGERQGAARLTVDDVRLIRDLHSGGCNTASIARTFGVGRTTIRRVLTGETWAHVKEAA